MFLVGYICTLLCAEDNICMLFESFLKGYVRRRTIKALEVYFNFLGVDYSNPRTSFEALQLGWQDSRRNPDASLGF